MIRNPFFGRKAASFSGLSEDSARLSVRAMASQQGFVLSYKVSRYIVKLDEMRVFFPNAGNGPFNSFLSSAISTPDGKIEFRLKELTMPAPKSILASPGKKTEKR